MPAPQQRIPVAVLGATGMVGQRLIQLLAEHPWFKVGALCASERSVGRSYGEACTWRLPGDIPAGIAEMPVLPCEPQAVPQLKVALSAMPSRPAKAVEAEFRSAGFAVVSNASAYRDDPIVPLVIPEVNPEHLGLIQRQPGAGYIVTNPNCCAIPLALALAPLHEAFGVKAVCASTWQAVSGAGYPGESAWDMVANVHPHPGNEEEKLGIEPQKILGSMDAPAAFPVSARAVRVPTADGHLISAQVSFERPCTPEQALEAWRSYDHGLELPSVPSPLYHLLPQRDRPQPRMDIQRGQGMAVSIGRVEVCPVMGLKFYALAHNTLRGAAGAALGNLELLQDRGLLPVSGS
ncbi:MAG: aspartate-semialdehyde dehydrogenase [Myxococcota bacterium]|nr:aspartate-semialdehyde dehydrogenase [Myxococcota bacterium]